MIPLMIDFAGKRVVIVGGGAVGARKARYFSQEAEVTVISRSFSPLLSGLDVRRIELDLSASPDHEIAPFLEGAFLAIAATSDPLLNDRIGEACRRRGVLFNNASGTDGDIVVPSVVSGDHFLLAISTGGESPAVSRFLREHLQATLPGLDHMVALQTRLRDILIEQEGDPQRRRRVLAEVLHDPMVWAAIGKGEEEAWQIVEEKYLK